MHALSERKHPLRILALYPHGRFTGHALLDEDELVLGATFATNIQRRGPLEARLDAVARLVRGSTRLYRPDAIVVVRSPDRTFAERCIEIARALLPLHVRDDEELQHLFVPPDAEEYDHLGQSVTRVFCPELARGMTSWRRGNESKRRRVRPVWKATAGAIAVMAELRPLAVRTMARGPLPPGLASALSRSFTSPDSPV
ncbi:MAG: hypothetical protein M5U28_21150 [Sandaracinaceae bacterium]|nr:hypothetical protein [Sandaracinaceae bacterium]